MAKNVLCIGAGNVNFLDFFLFHYFLNAFVLLLCFKTFALTLQIFLTDLSITPDNVGI
jgi:hypothetical protein